MIKRTMFGHKLNAKAPFKGVNAIPRYKPAAADQAVYPMMDLSKFDNLILDQGAEGDCTAASSGGCWMYLELLKWRVANPGFDDADFNDVVQSQIPVSMDFIYALELTHDGDFGQDMGSFGSTAAWVLSNLGACEESVCPNNGQGYFNYPSSAALAAAKQNTVAAYQVMDLADLRTCLSEGYPAWLGCPVFPSFVSSAEVMQNGVIPIPAPHEAVAGGHEMKVIGHDDLAGMLLIDNSWGTDVGIGGRFKMPYDYFHKYVSECYTARIK